MGDRLAAIDMGRKLGTVPLLWGTAGSPSNTMSPGQSLCTSGAWAVYTCSRATASTRPNAVVYVLFCSLAVLDPRVGQTMDVLSPLISILCHSDCMVACICHLIFSATTHYFFKKILCCGKFVTTHYFLVACICHLIFSRYNTLFFQKILCCAPCP